MIHFFEKHVIILGDVTLKRRTMPFAMPLPSLLHNETDPSSRTSTARVLEGIGHFKRYIVSIKELYNLPESGGARR